jgi:hypothetical protein
MIAIKQTSATKWLIKRVYYNIFSILPLKFKKVQNIMLGKLYLGGNAGK